MVDGSGDTDRRWMVHALELAARGRLGSSPNPMVGAVLLDANGKLAGEGWHARWGGTHAEVEALRAAGERARGGTLYVTLEPCSHHGKTPPCTEAVLKAGIRRVVIAIPDPNPSAGGGGRCLAEAGLEVAWGVGQDAAEQLNRRWLTWARTGRPWITLKAAISMDGRIATKTGESQWITGEAARRRGLELREGHDAILVGVGTVLADDPLLTRRLGLNPVDRFRRVVLDSKLRTPPDAELLSRRPEEVVLIHTASAPQERHDALRARGVGLIGVPEDPHGWCDLQAALRALAALPVASVVVEGGARILGSFVDSGICDQAVFFIAPLLIGGREAPCAVAGNGVMRLTEALRLRLESVEIVGGDVELRAGKLSGQDVHRSD